MWPPSWTSDDGMTAHVDIRNIVRAGDSRIVLLIVDGLGGYPHPDTGRSELEAARLPNLDALARESACGLTVPVAHGITPGSGPGHLALLGYDPVRHNVGRGVLEALGVGVDLGAEDAAARGNFCIVDNGGRLVDRRAGRISSERGAELADLLNRIEQTHSNISVHGVRGHRFVAVFHGAGSNLEASDTDPGLVGCPPLESQPLTGDSGELASAVNAFAARASHALKDSEAQAVVLRGISSPTPLAPFGDRYMLHPAAIAAYPMYRGLARLVGMEVLDTGDDFGHEVATLGAAFESGKHDFFFLHYKPADAAGEDGDFDAKVETLEALDSKIPEVVQLEPDVLVVAGDHSTPAVVGGHSWHPVPLAVRSRLTRGDGVPEFTERAVRDGSLGTIAATSVMTLALAHGARLNKFGP